MDAAGRGSPSALNDYYSGNRANNTVDADESTRSARTVSAALARRKGGFFGPLGGLRVSRCHWETVLKLVTRILAPTNARDGITDGLYIVRGSVAEGRHR